MSSTRFTFNPMTGSSGITTTNASALGYNNTHGDYRATATLTAGSNSETITLIQYGIPYASPTAGGTGATVTATGGTIPISVYAHYPFRFDNVPSWIRISDGLGNNYTDGQVIIASASTNGFIFTADPNTGTTARNGVVDFGFYRWGAYDALSASSQIAITQEAGAEEPYFIVSPTTALMDYYSGATVAFTVATNQQWGIQANENPDRFELEVGNGYLYARAKIHNQDGMSRAGEFSLTASTSSSTNYIIQAYEPVFSSYQTSIPQEGGTFHINLNTCYYWWFVGLPSWITVTDGNNNHYEQYTMNNPHIGESLVLTGNVAENTDGTSRSATIRLGFRMNDNTTGSTYQQINLTQDTTDVEVFVIPTPSSLTFDSGATAGTMQVISVSANTNWSASWNNLTGEFSFPYANTGGTGVTNLTVRYIGTGTTTVSDRVALNNSGPTVYVPVTKQGASTGTTGASITWDFNSTSLTYTGGTIDFTIDADNLMQYAREHYAANPTDAVLVVEIRSSDSGWEAWDYATWTINGNPATPDTTGLPQFEIEEGTTHIVANVSMPASVGESSSYFYGYLSLVFYYKANGTSYIPHYLAPNQEIYIFDDSE